MNQFTKLVNYEEIKQIQNQYKLKSFYAAKYLADKNDFTLYRCKQCNSKLKFNSKLNLFEPCKSFKCRKFNFTNQEFLQYITNHHLRNNNIELIEQLHRLTSHLDIYKNLNNKERKQYLLKYNLKKVIPICQNTNCTIFSFPQPFCSYRCSAQDKNTRNKYKQTCLKKYGVDNIFKDSKFIEKNKTHDRNFEQYKQTCLKKYGVDNPNKNKNIREKTKQTCLKKYGTDCYLTSEQQKQKNLKLIKEKTYQRIITLSKQAKILPLFQYEEYQGSKWDVRYNWQCKVCGLIFNYPYNQGIIPICYKCHPIKQNITQNQLYDYIKFYIPNVIKNNRQIIKPYELDIYIPSKKIAIEFNGNYWHSEQMGKDKNYHLNKTKICEEKEIQLIHIFEDEWIYKKQIVKNRLKHILGLTKYSIGARKCIIKEISSQNKNKFLDKYHIQGKDKSSVKLGAFYKDRLVAVMTFGKRRIALGKKESKDGEYELIRFCTVANFNVLGIAGKLLKYFERIYNPTGIISYADRRWSQGKVYKQLGFELSHISKPNYWYILRQNVLIRYHRFNYRKNILKYKLKNFDDTLTEYENMKLNGFTRIWDCGNYVFEKIYPTQNPQAPDSLANNSSRKASRS